MKILLILMYYPLNISGGASVYAEQLVRILSRHNEIHVLISGIQSKLIKKSDIIFIHIVKCSFLPVRSVMSNNIDGLLVKPGDSTDLRNKMEYLLKNTRTRNKFVRNGRKKSVRIYSWSIVSRKLNKILEASVK